MMTAVLRHRQFRRLWVAGTIDSLGSWLLVMSVPLQVFRLTGSAMSSGLALAVQAVPAVVVGPWAGVAVDRWPRKRVLVAANLAAAAGVGMMLIATDQRHVTYIFLGLLVESVATCLLRPAVGAITPSLVSGERDLAAANSLSAFSNSALRMLGPLGGTYLVAHDRFAAVVLIDASTYVIAAAIVAGIAVTAGPPAPPGPQLRDGLRLVLTEPRLRGLLVSSWAYWTGNAALTALLVPFTTTRLGGGQALGLLITGLGLGYVVGSAISGRLVVRYGVRGLLTVAYAAVGLCFVVLVNATALPVAVAALTVAGVPGVVAQIAVGYRLQASVPDAVLGRVSAAFLTGDAVAAVAGALTAAVVIDLTTLGAAMNVFAAGVLLTGAVAAWAIPRCS
jgi:predicted MFS family arabinose efflux permease